MRDEIELSKIWVPVQVAMMPLRGPALRVLLVLLKHADKSMKAFPGRDTILRYLPGMDRRNLARAMKDLMTTGVCEVLHTFDEASGVQTKNIYSIKIPTLKKIQEMSQTDSSAFQGVKNGKGRVSKTVQERSANRTELKPIKLKAKAVAPLGSLDRDEQDHSYGSLRSEAVALVSRFAELYRKKTGEPMASFPRHRLIMETVVGSLGKPAALAAVETWFESGPWTEYAKSPTVRWKLHGGFERCIEDIQFSDKYRAKKNAYAAGG
jgi:hypothetical protein